MSALSLTEDAQDGHKQNAQDEQEDGKAVDAMHVAQPLGIRRIGILLADIQIFSYLTHNPHILVS